MAIKKHKIFVHRLVIDFQYQTINCYRLLSIAIDYQFHRLIRPGYSDKFSVITNALQVWMVVTT